MQGKLNGIQNTALKQFLAANEIHFLNELQDKTDKINIELFELENKKEQVIEKNAEDCYNIEDNKAEIRIRNNNYEIAMESLNSISRNLYELYNNYNTISQLNNLIVDKCYKNFTTYNFKEDIAKLIEKVNLAEKLEGKVEDDDSKNYYIIDNYLNYDYVENTEENTCIKSNITIENLKDNYVLKITEGKVELPYTKEDVEKLMNEFPNEYKTPDEVIEKEFTAYISDYKKHPVFSRFKEAYSLCRMREKMSRFESFKFAKKIMFRTDINPCVIAAVKNKKQLEDYIECIEENKLEEYTHFKIVYEINPTMA